MKKFLSVTMMLLLVTGWIAGCSGGSNAGDSAEKKITVYMTVGEEPVKQAMREIGKEFEKKYKTKVEFQFPGNDYENILKVKMAANDLPDVFDTHGWAKIRYGKFLADLRQEPWASKMTDTIKPVLTDEQGKVYALPLNEAKDGITYNADLLKQYGIEPPQTVDQLMAAAEQIKKKSNGQVTPFFFAGSETGSLAQFFDQFATPLLISPQKNEAQALLNNQFDWNKWTYLPKKFLEMHKKGYMNKDVLTARGTDLPQWFAQGKVAFNVGGPSFVEQVKQINPNINVGYMPVPAIVPGDQPSFSGGERYTLGAWKDSKHLKEAKQFIAFVAQPENLKKIAEASKLPPGIKDITADLGVLTPYFEKYADTRVFPYFDRVYLPNGMWDVMGTLSQELLAGSITPEQYSQKMKEEFVRLRNQAR
ncbi:ABC transporter substrate-binding protein [Lihuaxuella thermophila]|uniref:Raffinose/stachyose/melibiose transport system substrate-binding protein n=1 Tax=Lihuaxuella thermophila TaxID=1173111 RepID=A0A1H8J0N9_9BACL|nr:extracellular solute-binding protein [Lihuaxuella thermophila]SEN73856.1 raffinose/stachyose/melibiose transport system substrate-binding protein [Lihuaxuella thermophila]